MKRAIPVILLIVAAFAGGALWMKNRSAADPPAAVAEVKPADEEAGPKVTRNANGDAVISMSDEVQGDIGIQVTNPPAVQLSPELKGYGRVLDPTPLAALMNELATAQAACAASSNELARLKTLEGQGNASTRALQAAEAAASRDQLAAQSANDRLAISWGKTVACQNSPSAFIQSLISLETMLVRVDLPAGETLSAPVGARIISLAGDAAEAEYLGPAPSVDPQMQGRGFLFQVKSTAARFAPGQAVIGYLKAPGESVAGVAIPREAVVRTEGSGWVYVFDGKGAEAFTRIEIPLDRPIASGWFITKGVKASDYVVINGGQQLLSLELKGQGE